MRSRRSTCCCRCSSPASPGSSTADAASQGKIFIEAQVKEGYDLSFSIAITAVSAVLAVIIPPSILMVVWGGVLQVSIGALYLAGVIPGLLIGLAQMATVHVYAKFAQLPDVSARDLQASSYRGDSRRSGADDTVHHRRRHPARLVHATESAAAAVIYAAVLSLVFYREMARKKLWHALLETGKLSAVALFCVGTASIFGWLLAYYQIPKALLANVTAWGMGPIGVGLLHRVRVPGRGLLPRCHPRDHHRRHDAAAAGGVGAHAPGVVRDHQHRRARLRPGDPAVRHVPDDLVRHRESPIAIRAQGHDDHAGADAAGAGGDDHLAARSRCSCRDSSGPISSC